MGSCLSSPNEIPTMSSSSSSIKKQRKRRKNEEERGRNGRGRGKRVVISDDSISIGKWEVREEELHRLSDRMFLNGSSEVACLFSQQGKKGINQDAMLVWENFASREDTIFCGVFDGHGPYGHMVSKKVRDALPLKLYTQWRDSVRGQNRYLNGSVPGSMNCEERTDEEWGESLDVDENERIPKMYLPLRRSLLEAFKLMDMELELHSPIDCFCSGTTAVAVIKQGQDLVIGNVGDSRAILGTRDKDNNLVALQLTEDLKPNLPREAARIQQCKGRVFALQEEPEVARVWLPKNDSPGLAMARAFGDFCLKDYGLISVPDISYHYLSEKDEFIVLATDGVWDVLSNEEAVDIVSSAATRGTSARALVDCAVRSWRLKFPTSKIDDCAAVCLFFNPQVISSQESQKEQKEQTSLCSSHEHESQQEEVDESATSDARTCTTSSHSSSTLATDGVEPKQEESKRFKPTRNLADCVSTSEEWSALEGVTRVNSLVNLARFSSDKRSSTSRKWL